MNSFLINNLRFVSEAGDKTFLMPIFGLVSALYLFYIKRHGEGKLVLFSLSAPLFAYLLKLLFRQPRPENAVNPFNFDKFGFPSAHTLSYTAFWCYIIYLCFKLVVVPLYIRIPLVLISIYFIALVGISRVYLGYHYIWDVAGGYLFGFLYFLLVLMLEKKLL